jgi:hypothetical protein
MVVDDIATAYWDDKGGKIECKILLGSKLNFIGYSGRFAKVQLPDGTEYFIDKESISESTLPRNVDAVIEHLQHFLGLEYLWGGTSPYGFDCSGMIYRVARVHGYNLARDAKDQALQGEEVKVLERGDLVFFGSRKDITHVALYLGGGYIIHAVGSSGGNKVIISPLKDYADIMLTARRVFI